MSVVRGSTAGRRGVGATKQPSILGFPTHFFLPRIPIFSKLFLKYLATHPDFVHFFGKWRAILQIIFVYLSERFFSERWKKQLCLQSGIPGPARQAGKTHLITNLKSKLTNLCSKLTNWTHLTTNLSISKLTNCLQRSFTGGRLPDIL